MKKIQHLFIRAILMIAFITSLNISAKAQPTTLLAGDIAFSGYHSGGSIDSFSIVFLKAVNSGTVINFTDNSWLGAAFRSGESHIAYTTAALPVGAEVTLALLSGTSVARWRQADGSFLSGGTIATTAGANPMALATIGDQVIAYQGTVAVPVFITAIHMNVVSTDATPTPDCGNTTALLWDPICITASAQTCILPTGLTTNQNCVWIGAEGRASSEWDNARFSGCGLDLSTPALMRAALNDSANWTLKSNGNVTAPTLGPIFSLPATCQFATQPNIIPTGSLAAFTACSGIVSIAQSFSVTAAYLTADLVITAPAGFEVSKSLGSGYTGSGGSVSITPSGGIVTATTIYVRLASTATGSPTGNINCTSTGAITRILPLSGLVNTTPSIPTIGASGSLSICAGNSVTLTSSTALGNQWFLDGNLIIGAINQNYVANATGDYTLIVTLGGCSSPVSLGTTVTVNTIPSTPNITAGGSTTFTAGGSVVLTSSAANDNQWYKDGNLISGETNQTYTATTAGVYTVIVTTNGCSSSASAGTTITVNPPATPTVSAGGPTTFFDGGSVTLSASSATGNQWYKDGNLIVGATDQTYSASTGGVYTVVTTIAGVSSAPSTGTTVTVDATPTVSAGGPTTFDAGSSVVLTSSYATGNQWYKDGNLISGETNQTYTATTAGVYTVVVTAGGSSSNPSTGITVTVNAPATPTVSAGGPTTFFDGGSVNLSASSATGNQWYKDGNLIVGATDQTYSATTGGVYTVVTTIAGVSSAPSTGTTVTVDATPTVSAGGPTTFDAGSSVVLTSSYATGNQWYKDGNLISGETNQTYTATTAGVYTVVVTAGGSSSNPSTGITVTVNAPATPTVSTGGPTTFFDGGSVTLSASSATGNQWYKDGNLIVGATDQTYSATTGGVYTVVTTIAGVSSAPSTGTTVTVDATPTASAGGPTTFDAGSSVVLTSSYATGNQWYKDGILISGETNQTYTATTAGVYTVVVTAGGSSSNPSTGITVTVNAPATPTVSAGGPTTFCNGGSVTLSSDAATGNQWYKDGNLISGETNQTYSATTSGDYTVIVTIAGYNSAASSAISVMVNPQVTSDTTASVCNQFTWHGTEYKASGDYVWIGTTAAGCDSTVTLHLTILSVTSTITKTDAVCYGTLTGSISVTPTYGVAPFTYRIGTLGSFVSSNTFNNLKVGKYTVSIIDNNGCRGITSQVTITQPLSITGTYTSTPTSCNGGANGTLTVTATRGTAPFMYRLGTTGSFTSTNNFASLKAGVYKVYIQDATGCTGVISAIVSQPSKVNGTFTVTNASCPGMANGTVTLNGSGGIPPYTYRWGTVGGFSIPNTFTGISEGSYRVFVLDAHNCYGYSVLATVANASPVCSTRPLATRSAMINDERSKEKDVMLTPNPTNNQFVFKSGSINKQAIQLRVFDTNGKVILSAKPSPDQPFRFGEELQPGIYMVEITQGTEVKIVKAVKIR